MQGTATTVEADELLDGLTAAQRHAVTVEAAPLCVLAGAGAGKTRVLTRRIAHRVLTGSADASHVLVITFTRKASGELGGRLAELGLRDSVQAGTFHAVAAAQLRRWWADRGVTAPALLDRKARILAPLLAGRPGLAGMAPAEVAGHIEWAKARLVGPNGFEEAATTTRRALGAPAGAVASLYQRYEDEKRRRGLLDFDDLLGRCATAFDTDPAFASAQRWRWRHVFVDEFQDVNPLQHRLLLAWLGSGVDLCVVGDPHQAIYSWNGADPGLLDRVVERWPATTVVRLDDNHRCSPQIVAVAAAVLGDGGGHLRSSRPDGPVPTVRSYPSDEAEAHGVAGALRAAHAGGTTWAEMAVLVRTNAQVVALCQAFTAAGVPHRAPGRLALLDDPAVAAVLAEWRRTSARPVQMVVADLEAALRGRRAGPLGPGGAGAGVPGAGAGGVAGAGAAGAGAAGAGDGGAVGPGEEAAIALAALVDLARSFERFEGPGTVGGLLQWLTIAGGGHEPRADDAVTVCSFHRAKGLEWPAVWVCGLEAGLVPIGRADTPGAVAEERRLLYVALTRAGSRLSCSWSETRRFGSKPVPRTPSPYLALIAGEGGAEGAHRPGDATAGVEAATVLSPEQWRARLDEQRRRLSDQRARSSAPDGSGPPARRAHPGASHRVGVPARTYTPGQGDRRIALPTPDGELLAALEAWRASVARASGVPAHVVLHDRTLEALAALRPSSTDALMAVPGVGPVRAGRLGPAILSLVAQRRASA